MGQSLGLVNPDPLFCGKATLPFHRDVQAIEIFPGWFTVILTLLRTPNKFVIIFKYLYYFRGRRGRVELVVRIYAVPFKFGGGEEEVSINVY